MKLCSPAYLAGQALIGSGNPDSFPASYLVVYSHEADRLHRDIGSQLPTAQVSRDLVVAAHQELTVEWWEKALPRFEPFVSPVVLEEIAKGDPEAARKRIRAVKPFRVLEVVPAVRDLAERYFTAIDLPEKVRADAYHLALAVWHGMNYLVTWNCTHIAGGKVKLIVQGLNAEQGVESPIICTPEELMEV